MSNKKLKRTVTRRQKKKAPKRRRIRGNQPQVRNILSTELKVATRRLSSEKARELGVKGQLDKIEVARDAERFKRDFGYPLLTPEEAVKLVDVDDITVPEGFRVAGMDEIATHALDDCKVCNSTGKYRLQIKGADDDEICLCECAYKEYQKNTKGLRSFKNGVLVVPVEDAA